jgi:hypothetical protein
MKARHYLILMAVAILVPVTVIAGAGLSMLLSKTCTQVCSVLFLP